MDNTNRSLTGQSPMKLMWLLRIAGAIACVLGFGLLDAPKSLAACPLTSSYGSYATTGVNKNSTWWLNWECYDDSVAKTSGGQPFSFTLPDGSTLSTTVKRTGTEGVVATSSPSWGGSAVGNGQYNSTAGKTIFYSADHATSTLSWQIELSGITVKDKGGNSRNFTIWVADGESTDSSTGNYNERLTFATNGTNWNLVELIPQSGTTSPTSSSGSLGGTGSTTATWTAPRSNNNGSLILSTNNPTTVTAASTPQGKSFYGKQGVFMGLGLPKITLIENTTKLVKPADRFTTQIAYTLPTYSLAAPTSANAALTVSTGAISVLPGNVISLNETMATGSTSALTTYSSSIACTNANNTSTALPSGSGTSFSVTPQIGDDITCTITNTPAAPANLLLIKRITEINGDRIKNPNDTSIPLNGYYPTIDNPATTNDNNANWPDAFLVGAYSAGKIKPSDVIEYTVYFMNASGAGASGVKICDRIVGVQTFLTDAYGTGKDIEYRLGNNPIRYLTKGADTVDRAQLNTSTGTIAGCPDPTGLTGTNTTNNGTVVIDITGTGNSNQDDITAIPGATSKAAPSNSYGYLRFKTRINP
jgi:hypothetical protein